MGIVIRRPDPHTPPAAPKSTLDKNSPIGANLGVATSVADAFVADGARPIANAATSVQQESSVEPEGAALDASSLEAFQALADRLAAPEAGKTIGKPFERGDAQKLAYHEEARLEGKLTALTSFLVAAEPTAQTQQAKFLSQFGHVFARLWSTPRAGKNAASTLEHGSLEKSGLLTMFRSALEEGDAPPPPIVNEHRAAFIPAPNVDPRAMQQAVQQVMAQHSHVDIEQLVENVLFELGLDSDQTLREFMMQMQERLKEKQRLNGLSQKFAAAKKKMEAKINDEFLELQSKHLIGKNVPLEDYRAWRKISWSDPTTNAAGDFAWAEPTTAQPWPPVLPTYLSKDRNTATPAPAPATTSGQTSQGNVLAIFGISPKLRDDLHKLYAAIPRQLKTDGEQTLGFEAWLRDVVGLNDSVTSIDDVLANADRAKAFVEGYFGKNGDIEKEGTHQANASSEYKKALLAQLDAFRDGPFNSAINAVNARGNGQINDGEAAVLNDVMSRLSEFLNLIPPHRRCFLTPDDLKAVTDEIGGMINTLAGASYTTEEWQDVEVDVWVEDFSDFDPDDKGRGQRPDQKPSGHYETRTERRKVTVSHATFAGVSAGSQLNELKTTLDKAFPTDLTQQEKAELYAAKPSGEEYRTLPKQSDFSVGIDAEVASVHQNQGLGIKTIAEQLKQNLDAILKNNKPPLTPEQREIFAALSASYKPETAEDFLSTLQSELAKKDYRAGGASEALTQAIVGDTKNDELARRAAVYITGDSSGVQLTDWEKQLVKNKIIEDPAAIAARRKEAIGAQAQREKDEVTDRAAKDGQLAAPGDTHLGGLEELEAQGEDINVRLEACRDLSQMDTFRIQTLMDRRSKFFETLSNIMKRISTTAEGIISNVKV